MNHLKYPINTIIQTANDLQVIGKTTASSTEQIAAAFVLNNQNYLPPGYENMVQAWDRLDTLWQGHVRIIQRNYMYLIKAE